MSRATAFYPAVPTGLGKASKIPSRPDALNLAQRADLCVRWLRKRGFEVLCVQGGRYRPRVHVRTSALCEQLDGVVYMYERVTHDGKPPVARRYWVAIRFGCEVRWTESEANHAGQ